MKTIKFCMIAAAAVLVMGSCASKKDLVAAQSKLETCQSDNNNLQVELAKYQAQNKALETQVAEKNATITEMKEGMKIMQHTLDNSINQGGANISKLVDEINASNKYIKQLIDAKSKSDSLNLALSNRLTRSLSKEELKDVLLSGLYQHEYRHIDRSFPYPELTLAELGIPPYDVLHVSTGENDYYMEMEEA